MTPEGDARIATAAGRRRLSHPAAAETGVRPAFKRSVVIHSSYCSAPITALPVIDVLLRTGRPVPVPGAEE